MDVAYNKKALDDINFWRKAGNDKVKEKISALIEDIKKHPFTGIGKPEPLKFELSGKWSRRIDKENRIVYTVTADCLRIYSLKGHY